MRNKSPETIPHAPTPPWLPGVIRQVIAGDRRVKLLAVKVYAEHFLFTLDLSR